MNFSLRKRRREKVERIKPIYIMHQAGLDEQDLSSVLDGIRLVIQATKITPGLIQVKNWGVWRQEPYLDQYGLKPYHSVDWYLQRGQEESNRRNQLNADTIIRELYFEPWRKAQDHYDVFITDDDLYSGDDNNNFVIGVAQELTGTVVSTARFKGLGSHIRHECIVTEIMHEFGHVLGLIPDSRTSSVEYSLGPHCTNECVMRQGLSVPNDWIRFTEDRIRTRRPFCRECQGHLENWFR
ncbi:MAG: hypothetical protein GF349_00400 [Candidatus Magasanikbacteria bacterium]|nr:hypothetical protein [Candidatus Magasanikbacteria bacterium]